MIRSVQKGKFKTNKEANDYLISEGEYKNNGLELHIPSDVTCIEQSESNILKKTIKCSELNGKEIKDIDYYTTKNKLENTDLNIVEYNDEGSELILEYNMNSEPKHLVDKNY